MRPNTGEVKTAASLVPAALFEDNLGSCRCCVDDEELSSRDNGKCKCLPKKSLEMRRDGEVRGSNTSQQFIFAKLRPGVRGRYAGPQDPKISKDFESIEEKRQSVG